MLTFALVSIVCTVQEFAFFDSSTYCKLKHIVLKLLARCMRYDAARWHANSRSARDRRSCTCGAVSCEDSAWLERRVSLLRVPTIVLDVTRSSTSRYFSVSSAPTSCAASIADLRESSTNFSLTPMSRR